MFLVLILVSRTSFV
ncbi:hypothetical protein LINPERHAP2_LOCUS29538 [Linum perenne]